MNAGRRSRARTALRRGLGGGLLAAMLGATAFASPAAADFGIAGFDGDVINRDAAGNAVAATQAGSHPEEVNASIAFNSTPDPGLGASIPDEDVRNIRVDLPVGFTGNPTVVTQCREPELESGLTGTACPPDSQVGVTHVVTTTLVPMTVPVFNMVPPPGVPAAFGFRVGNVPIHLRAVVRSESDYGLSILVPNISQAAPILSTELTFWGVPADPAHDLDRGAGLNRNGSRAICADIPDVTCSNTSGLPQQAFLTNPMVCNGPVETLLSVTSWRGSSDGASFLTHLPSPDEDTLVGPDGCERVPFDASLNAQPMQRRAASPSGFTFDLSVPQNASPSGIAQSHLKKAVVRLPAGVSVSPPSAAGLAACPDAQTGIGNANDPNCPEASKIGTLSIDTPLLEDPLRGDIYLRQPKPGNLFRLLLVASGRGVLVKLPGDVHPDPVTGQLTAVFDNNPQLPFSNLHLAFKDGPRAPLTLPPTCGTYTTTAELTSWSGRTARSQSSFAVTRDGNGAPCPARAFTPDFVAGLANPVGGSSSTFSVRFGRDDEDPTLRDLTVDMPEGLTGKIADATLCAEAQAAAGTCGEESRIGSTMTGAGPGTNPFFLPGRVYLTGPYKGAPFGLSIVVPAVAGPFDLGTVVVRAAIAVDKRTAKLRIASDPLPSILEGVPLLIRKVTVAIDKPGFMIAPTSCAPKRISGQIGSNEGLVAAVGSRFQVGSCGALPFKPKMGLRVGKKGRTRPGITVPFKTVVRMTPGQANIRSVRVNLPKNINARLPVINNNACPLADYESGKCPERLAVGSATAVTPLLKDPLRGKAYFVRNPARRIPDLVVALKGQVDIDLVGKVSIPRNLTLATTFDTVPDVPITKFTLNLVAGRSGPIGTIGNLCSKRVRRGMKAKLAFRGQNGRAVSRSQRMKIFGCRNVKVKARGKKGKAHAKRGASNKSKRGAPKRKRK